MNHGFLDKFLEISKAEVEYAKQNLKWEKIVKENIEEYKKFLN